MPGKKKKSRADQQQKNLMNDLASILRSQQRATEEGEQKHKLMQQVGIGGRPDTLEELQKDVKELYKPLLKLLKLQKQPASTANSVKKQFPAHLSKQERFDAFKVWMRKEAPNSLLDTAYDFDLNVAEGVGVVATKDLANEEVFLKVPRNITMSTDTCLASPVGAVIMHDQMCLSMPSLALAMHVLCERLNPKSFWKPYLDVLAEPGSVVMPSFFTDDELAELEGSPTFYDSLNLKKSNIRQYTYLYRLMKRAGFLTKLPSFRFEDFQWAVAIVMTRQNSIPRVEDPDQSMIALLPAFDFVNYRPGRMTTYYDTEGDCSETTTMQAVKKGDPVYMFYGNRPNSKIFQFNGFVVDDHPTDVIEIALQLPPNDPLFKIKNLFLRKMNWSPSTVFTFPSRTTEEMYAMLQFCRISVLDKAEATICLKAPEKLFAVDPLNDLNENNALQFFIHSLQNHLNRYPTTYEQDAAILNSCAVAETKGAEPSHTSNARLCIHMRRSEKKLMHEAIYVYQDRLDQLTSVSVAETKTTPPAPAVTEEA